MKQLIILILSLALMLTACQQEKVREVRQKPDIEVKVKTNEAATEAKTAERFNTKIYNEVRDCLLNSTCQRYTTTREYSRAWNNLAAEGYLCQDKHCMKSSEEESTEFPVTENPVIEAPVTEIPVTEDMTTEITTSEESVAPVETDTMTTESVNSEIQSLQSETTKEQEGDIHS